MENFRAVTAVPCYMGAVISSFSLIVKIIMVISVVLYVTDKGEHTAPYKINNSVYIKTSKMINYIVAILYSLCSHMPTCA